MDQERKTMLSKKTNRKHTCTICGKPKSDQEGGWYHTAFEGWLQWLCHHCWRKKHGIDH